MNQCDGCKFSYKRANVLHCERRDCECVAKCDKYQTRTTAKNELSSEEKVRRYKKQKVIVTAITIVLWVVSIAVTLIFNSPWIFGGVALTTPFIWGAWIGILSALINKETKIVDTAVWITQHKGVPIEKAVNIATYGTLAYAEENKVEAHLSADAMYEKFCIDNYQAKDGVAFEKYVAEIMLGNGYSNIEFTPVTGDWGADIIATDKNGFWVCVQCKHYSKPLGLKPIQEIQTAKTHYRCQRTVVATNNTFTVAARKLADECRVELWDKDTLANMVEKIV